MTTPKDTWISVKVGDKVIQIERTSFGDFKHEAIVTKIDDAFIETCYCRHPYPEIIALVENLISKGKLTTYHRTWGKIWHKNYFHPKNLIDIELLSKPKNK